MKVESSGWSARNFIALVMVLCGLQAVAQSRGGPGVFDTEDQENLRVPVGTVLPVRLNHGFSAKSARAGQVIRGRVMQDVPLPNGRRIPEGAKVAGMILSVSPSGNNSGNKISFRFDRLEIHHRRIPIVTSLRALASFMEVGYAQVPEAPTGFGTPYNWATTDQIGGDVKYGVGGPVTDHWSRTIGQGVFDGVLVHVRAQPGSHCRGAMDDEDRLQALWVFSSDACGVFGMAGVKILHAGRTEPEGEIVLASERGDLKVQAGSGMLLRVVR